jgi:hypothetical protein
MTQHEGAKGTSVNAYLFPRQEPPVGPQSQTVLCEPDVALLIIWGQPGQFSLLVVQFCGAVSWNKARNTLWGPDKAGG